MIWIYRYIIGNLRVRFFGDFSEKALNLTVSNGINIWNSKLVKNGIETNISVRDFKRLRKIIRNSGIRVHIIKRYGLPFIINKNRKRLGIAFGLVFLVLFLNFISSNIWIIEVKGNKKIPTDTIISSCEEIGIRKGILKKKINSKRHREELLLKMDQLAWASLNIEGCKLTVNISEIKKTDKDAKPCNIKASSDGIIKKIDVKSGNCLVKTGDVVKQGDILVSGVIEKPDSTEFVTAKGVITALVKKEIVVESDYKVNLKSENGKVKKKSVIEFFNFKIPLFLGKEKGEYNSKMLKKPLKLFKTELPIAVYTKEFRFVTQQTITYTEEKVIELLEKDLTKELKNEKIIEYKIEQKEIIKSQTGIKIRATVLLEKDITYSDIVIIGESGI